MKTECLFNGHDYVKIHSKILPRQVCVECGNLQRYCPNIGSGFTWINEPTNFLNKETKKMTKPKTIVDVINNIGVDVIAYQILGQTITKPPELVDGGAEVTFLTDIPLDGTKNAIILWVDDQDLVDAINGEADEQ